MYIRAVRTNLFEETTFLEDIGDSFLLYASCFVDILERIELFCLLVFDDTNLLKSYRDKEERGMFWR